MYIVHYYKSVYNNIYADNYIGLTLNYVILFHIII